jgi:predicted nuclease of predicted toxin-antitoxin system
MRFKIDENLPIELSDLLTAAGHDAITLDQRLWIVDEASIRIRGGEA